MKDCRKIEPLVYLYREGELSAQEKAEVLEHAKTCPKCGEILQQLLAIESTMVKIRESVPEARVDARVVAETMERISGKNPSRIKVEVSKLDEILWWLRPAFGIILLACAILFIAQQTRDARQVTELEGRLRARGNVAANPFRLPEGLRIEDIVTEAGGSKTPFSSKLRSAGIGSNTVQLLGSGLAELFRHNSGLFEELAHRYPELSGITLEDGLDERERKILATEGKAFIKEFEQLLQEGEK
jgi:hypothetical protein